MSRSTIASRVFGLRAMLGRMCFAMIATAWLLAPTTASAQTDTPLYWDTNGTTAGSGAATGTWGTSDFWNADPLGIANSFTIPTTSSDDVFFSAGANGATGTVTISGAEAANSITFQNNVAITLSGGTSLTLGGGTGVTAGISVLAGDNAANTISTPVLLNSGTTAATFSNAGTGLLTVGAITGAATSGTQTLTLSSSNTGGITLNGVIGDGAGGGNVAMLVNSTGSGTLTLSGANTFTGGLTITAGTINVGNAAAFGTGTLRLGGGAINVAGFTLSTANPISVTAGTTTNLYSTGGAGMTGPITSSGTILNKDPGGGTSNFTIESNISGFTGTLDLENGSDNPNFGGSGSGAMNGSQAHYILNNASSHAVNFNAAGVYQMGDLSGSGAISSFSTTTLQIGALNTSTLFSGTIGQSGSGVTSVAKVGTGTLILSGADGYTGGTTISAGTLVGKSTTALGSNGNLNIAALAAFDYEPTAAGALNLGSGVLTLNNGSILGAAVGGTASQSAITSSAIAASVAGDTVTVNISGIPGVAPTAGANTLLSVGASSTLSAGTFSLGNVYNAINFTVSPLTTAATTVSTTVTAQTALTSEFWLGGFSGNPGVWAVSTGLSGGSSNWASAQSGTATPLTPGSGATITFSANGATNQGAMTLGANMSVAGIVVNDTTPLVLGADGNTLTLGTGGITVNTTSGNPTVTLGTPITFGSGQTWTNNSTNPLNISGAVATGANQLTITGTGTTSISGAISGSGTLVVSNGTLALSGSSEAFGAAFLGNTTSTTITPVLSISAGTATFSNNIGLGNATGSRALFDISGTASVTANGTFLSFGGNAGVSGPNFTSSGAIYQSGGTFNINVTSNVLMPWAGGAGGAYGAYVLSGGTLNQSGGAWVVNNQTVDIGLFSQSGGTATIADAFLINGNGNGSGSADAAIVDISGGTFTHTSGNFMGTQSNGATGVVGVLTVRGTGTLQEQTGNFFVTGTSTSAANGVVNLLTGGTIIANQIQKVTASTSAVATINFDGGTLRAYSTNAGANFLTGLNNAFVYPGGVTVNNSGTNITIGQALIVPAGFGIGTDGSTIAVSSGGTGYIAPPVVTFAAPAGGVPATGVAVLNGSGTVTGIIITSPGSGYTNGQSVAVSFNGGSNAADEATTVATVPTVSASTVNTSGGLTLTGSGVTTLTGANTYTGTTTISAGTLQIGNGGTSGTLGSGAITNNGTLVFDRSDTGLSISSGISGIGIVQQIGSGTTTLGGTNGYTGATTISAGTLNLTGSLASTSVSVASGAAIAGTGSMSSAALTVSGGGAVTLASGNSATSLAAGSLSLGSAGTYGSGVFSTLNYTASLSGVEVLNDLGSLTANNVFVNISGTLPNNTYTLLQLQLPSSIALNNFSLSSSVPNTPSIAVGRQTYTINDGTKASALTLTVTGAANPGVAYWDGAVSTAWNDVSNATKVNWSTNLAGTTDGGNIPGATSDIILNASNQSGTVMTTLGANLTINSLNVNGNGTSTIGFGNTLTINGLADNNTASDGSYTGNSTGLGISIGSAANAFTVVAGLTLGGSQSWINSSANTFTVAGAVGASGTLRTLTLQNTSTGNTVVSGAISNGGGTLALIVNNTGSGTTTLSNTNTYSGGTTLDAGTLSFANSALGSSAITFAGNSTLQWNGSNTQDISSQLAINNGVTGTLDIQANNVTFASGFGGGTSGNIVKIGSGTLTLGSNTYTGTTTISNGTLILNGNSAADSGAGYVLGDSNTGSNNVMLQLGSGLNANGGNTAATVSSRLVDVTVSSQGSSTATINVGSAGISTDMVLVLDRAATIKGPLNQLLTSISGPGAGAGNTSLTIDVNGGNLVWTSNGTANTFTGNVHIINSSTNAGQLQMQNNAYVANDAGHQNLMIPDGSSVTLDANITWAIVHGVETIDALNGAGTITDNAGTNYLANTPTLTVGAAGGSGSYSGIISNSGGTFSFGKTGAGTQILSGANTYAGATTISGGTLQLGNGGTTGSLSATTAITDNATLAFDRNDTALSVSNTISGSGAVAQIGSGTTTLTGTNTYSGGTIVNAGVLSVGTIADAGTSNIGQSSGGSNPLRLGGGTLRYTGASTATTGRNVSLTGVGTVSSIVVSSGATLALTGVISDGGGGNGLTLGAGTTGILTLAGTSNSYTGPTNVNAGTLNLTGSLASTTAAVASGAILTGTGSMSSAALSVSGGGTVRLGSAISSNSLNVGSLALGTSSPNFNSTTYATLSFAAGPSGIEYLNDLGSLTSNNVLVSFTTPVPLGTYTLLQLSSPTALNNFSLSSGTPGVYSTSVGRDTYAINGGATARALTLTVSGIANPGVAYWDGAVSNFWNDSSNESVVNWSSNSAGTVDAGNIPGAVTDVILNASNQTGMVTTTLGANTTINSLNVNGNGTNTIGVGNTLTINALADSNTAPELPSGNPAGQGISIGSAANAFTINAGVTLGGSQAWINGSANTFTVTGAINGSASTGSQVLTLQNTSSGNMSISGVIGDGPNGGNLTLVVNSSGSGAVTLPNANTYSGGTTLNAGLLSFANSALGSGSVTFAGNSTLQWNGTNTQDISAGLVISSGVTATLDTQSNNVTFASGFGGGTGGGLVKAGSGTLTFNGANTYTGTTTISGGTLVLNSNSASDAAGYVLGDGNTGSNNVALQLAGGFNSNNTTASSVSSRLINVTVSSQGTGSAIVNVGSAGTNPDLNLVIDRATTIVGPKNQLMASISGPGAGAGNTSLIMDVAGGNFIWSSNGTADTFTGNVHIINSSTTAGQLQMQNVSYEGNTAANQNLMIPDSSSVTLDSNITWAITHGVETIDGLNGSGTIRNVSGTMYLANTATLTVGAAGGGGTFSGVMQDGGLAFSLAKTGAGTQILSGANIYTGTTTISGGTLQIGAAGSTGTLGTGGNVVDNATLAFDRSDTGLSVGNAISGSGTVEQIGSGTATLTGTNSYQGATTISAGTLVLSNTGTNNNIASSSSIRIAGGAFLNVSGLGTGPTAGSFTLGSGTAAQTLNGPTSGIGTVSGNLGVAGTGFGGGTISVTSGATLSITGALAFAGGSIADFALPTSPNPGAPLITVGGTFIPAGSGTTGVNLAFTTLSPGTYDLIGAGSGLSSASGFTLNTVAPGGYSWQLTAQSNQLDLVVVAALAWTGANSGGGSNSSWDTAGSTNWAGGSPLAAQVYAESSAVTFGDINPINSSTITNSTVNVQSSGVNPASVTFTNNTVPYTINSTGSSIGIGGGTGITLNGAGTVTLVGSNTYTGTTMLNAGILVVSNNSSLGSTSGTIAPLTFSGGTLQYAPSSTNTDISGRTVMINGGGATVDINGNNVTYANSIGSGGSGALTVVDSGSPATLILQGTNTFTGPVNLNGGTVRFGTLANLGAGTAINFGGGALQWANGTSTDISAQTVTIGAGGAMLDINGNNVAFANPIGNGGNGALTVTDSGSAATLTLTASNSYSGATNLNGGTVRFSSLANLGSGAAINFGGGALKWAGGNFTDISTQTVTIGVGGATFDINGNNVSLSNSIGNNGSGGLTLINSGSAATLTLANSNTYAGATNVNTGTTLLVSNTSGSATGGGSVNIHSGGTLAGNGVALQGFIGGNVAVASGATISPSGGGVAGAPGTFGTLTVGGLTLNSTGGAQLNYQATSSTSLDLIAVTGALALPTSATSGSTTFNFYQPGTTSEYLFGTGTYQLISYQSITGGGANLNSVLSVGFGNGTWPGGDTATFSTTSTSGPGTLDLVISAAASSSATWKSNGLTSADYGTGSNWSSGGVPNGAGFVATFGTGTTQDITFSGGNYTVGGLVFNNPNPSVFYSVGSDHSGSLSLNNSGGGASVVASNGAAAVIGTTLTLADPSLSTTFNIDSSSSLEVTGPINESTPTGQKIILNGGGILQLDNGANAYTGGTTVNSGTLIVDPMSGTATLGSGPLAINGSSSVVNMNSTLTVGSLSGSGGGQLNVAGSTTLTVNQSTSSTFNGTFTLDGGLVLANASGNTLTISGAPTLGSSSSITVNSGTLALTNNTGNSASVTGTPTASVAIGATLQLAGSSNVLSSAVNITTHGSGLASDGALTVVGASTQTVGIVTGDALPDSVTTYSGNTTVGDGTNAANLTATQILQNTLTINAGSTVTIAPSGSGIPADAALSAGSGHVAADSDAVSSAATADSSDSSTDPFTAIQAAIASGSIGATKGQQLENRIAAIERLAATDPGLDVSLLEDRVLAAIPAASVWSSSGTSPLLDPGSGLLAADSSTFASSSGSTSGGPAMFAAAADFGGSPAAVPEPSTLLLAALGGFGLALVALRRALR